MATSDAYVNAPNLGGTAAYAPRRPPVLTWRIMLPAQSLTFWESTSKVRLEAVRRLNSALLYFSVTA
eukprot:2839017-Rhodomonas_salina.3